MATPLNVFKYRPLYPNERPDAPPTKQDKETIRLVEILPNADRIHCAIRHVQFANNPRYTTLSYACGPQESGCMITAEHADDVAQSTRPTVPNLRVTLNLHKALVHLRDRYVRTGEAKVLFWIDALCIHQTDIVEKSCQILLMYYIYSRAQQTIVWLGPEEAERCLDVVFLEKLLSVQREQRARQPPDKRTIFQLPIRAKGTEVWTKEYDLPLPPDKRYTCLYTLLDRPWFSRTWIVQEAAVSRNAIIHCGAKTIPLVDFLKAVSYCTVDLGVGGAYKGANVLKVTKLYNAWYSQQPGQPDGRVRQGLLELLQQHRDSSSGDPRDKIFALMGLASDIGDGDGELQIKVDYTPGLPQGDEQTAQQRRTNDEIRVQASKDAGVRYNALAYKIIRSRNTLDILSSVRIPGRAAQKPLWIAIASWVLHRLPLSGTPGGQAVHKPSPIVVPPIVVPSWVPNWTHLDSFTTFRTKDEFGQYLFPFAAAEPAQQSDIDLGGHVLKTGNVELESTGDVLTIKGFEWATIGEIGQPGDVSGGGSTFGFTREYRQAISRQRVMHGWEKLCCVHSVGTTYYDASTQESMRSAYWRALVAGSVFDRVEITEEQFNEFDRNTRPFNWIFDLHIASIPLLCHIAYVGVLAFIALRNLVGQGGMGLVFQTRMGLTTPNRRMFVGASLEGRVIGLAPATAKPGDRLCFCKGAMVPLVLRKQDHGNRLIGDAYVHGAMMGDAFRPLGHGGLVDIALH
ncbi:hypothetical protein LTR36_006404 [Oleoguttula mirabilis]|uniref:Heterokaryon incompatibility domain-containing protein n=1 Tax=Oleoguttula mirabilis TaxID=1507867 RepID=A0AAV9JUM4_9PEZI|nr:hypothetical protein LTR36_006404 [Oleoguttula mirabilis]